MSTPDNLRVVPSCAICGSPTGDGGQLCRVHTDELRRELASVPGLVTDLEVTRSRQDRVTAGYGRPSGSERPLMWNEAAAQVAWELQATLNAWALDVSHLGEDERDLLAAVDYADVPELAQWLVRNLPTLRLHDEAGTAYEELIDSVRRARRMVDRPATSSKFRVGPCPESPDGEGTTCPGEVWAFIASGEDRLSWMRCQECDAGWDSTQWVRAGRRILAQLARQRLSVRAATVRR